jgi:hypothetical protein
MKTAVKLVHTVVPPYLLITQYSCAPISADSVSAVSVIHCLLLPPPTKKGKLIKSMFDKF